MAKKKVQTESVPAKKTVSITNAVEKVLICGDLSGLSERDRISYFRAMCKSLGLNPLTKPFEYLKIDGKLVLYANKGCAEQIRSLHRISVKVVSRERLDDLCVVTVEVSGKDGRVDSAVGVVSAAGLRGTDLANAMMKAETKAKRRATLSLVGLNMIDESEIETTPGVDLTPSTAQKPDSGKQAQAGGREDGGEYVCQFGVKYKGVAIRSIEPEDLRSYVAELRASAAQVKRPLGGAVRDFVQNAEAFLLQGAGLSGIPVQNGSQQRMAR